jgi:hypothetical protein
MKKFYTINVIRIFFAFIFVVTATSAFSQLKIGTNPTQINKSSILELESDRQGFLLPRLTDTTSINTLTPPDGMLIYLATPIGANRGLYIRKSGIWQRFTTDSVSLDKWSKSGDILLGNEKLGSTNLQTLRLITNNIDRLTIDGTTGNVNIANSAAINKSLAVQDSTVTGKLGVADSVSFKKINRSANLTEVLVIDTANGGSVRRRTIATDAFKNWFVGAFKNTNDPNGLEKVTGTISDSLVLHAASTTTPGGVSIANQTFGGNKTFQDSVAAAKTLLVGSAGSANSTLQVQGSVSLSIRTISANTSLTGTDYTVLVNAAGGAVTVTLPPPSLAIVGRTYIIKKIAGGLTYDVTVSGAIEDGSSFSLYNDWTVVKVQTDGNKWYIIK